MDRWQDRFTRPRIVATRVAPADRTAGLVTVADGTGIHLCAWDVPTGTTRPVTNLPGANLWQWTWLGHDGRYAYVLADEASNELGHLVAVDLHDDRVRVDLTPALDPYTVRGVDLSHTGAGLVLDAVDASGYSVYYLADPAAVDPPPRLLARSRHEAWEPRLSADGTVATVDVTDHNPGVRRYAVQALRVADGASLGRFTDPPHHRARWRGPWTSRPATARSSRDGSPRHPGPGRTRRSSRSTAGRTRSSGTSTCPRWRCGSTTGTRTWASTSGDPPRSASSTGSRSGATSATGSWRTWSPPGSGLWTTE